MTHVLVTGATGLIGRFLLRDLLGAGIPIVALVRGSDPESRVSDIVAHMRENGVWPEDLTTEGLRVVSGDLASPSLGLQHDAALLIRDAVSCVLHCAGDVSFQSSTTDGIGVTHTNLQGTIRLADFARMMRIRHFAYVSTAFVCGNRTGTIYEHHLDSGQAFGSEYEKSKHDAERYLHDVGFPRLDVFRPCSVTGDTLTGYTSTFHGLYWFALFTSLARLRAGGGDTNRWRHDVRLFFTGEERHHLIPVDKVSQAIVSVLCSPANGTSTYHLTPPHATSLRELEVALCSYYQYEGVRFAASVPRTEWNETETLFYDGLATVGHRYLHADPTFDRTATTRALPWWDDISLRQDYFQRLFAFAESQRFGRTKARKQQMSQ